MPSIANKWKAKFASLYSKVITSCNDIPIQSLINYKYLCCHHKTLKQVNKLKHPQYKAIGNIVYGYIYRDAQLSVRRCFVVHSFSLSNCIMCWWQRHWCCRTRTFRRAFLKLKMVRYQINNTCHLGRFSHFVNFSPLSQRINTSEQLIYDNKFKFNEHVEFFCFV